MQPSRRETSWRTRRRLSRVAWGSSFVAFLFGCPVDSGVTPVNPFVDLPPIARDGRVEELTNTIVPLGLLVAGDVLQIDVSGDGIDAVLVLAEDKLTDVAGVMVGGGPANKPFLYRVSDAGRFFVFVLFDPQLDESQRRGTIRVEPGDDPTFVPPGRQSVLFVFHPDYLTAPGLFDEQSGTPDDLAVLDAITDTVREGIITRLKSIFAGTPVEILTEDDPMPDPPFSSVTFLPDRVLADDPLLTDTALAPPDPSRPECKSRVVFGEVLSRGARFDPGNHLRDDKAVVYVGSFQGRGETCQSAALNSVNNIILGLAQTAAHEVGHLVGLFHVPLTDIMDRSPTMAFQRELSFQRGQLLIDAVTQLADGTSQLSPILLTTVIQDPALYFRANFGP